MATASEHLKEIINVEDNQQHNLEYDMSSKADAECIRALVEFSYTGELTFTEHNFNRLSAAVREFKMTFIDDESIQKIGDDIEQSKAKKDSSELLPTVSQTMPSQPTYQTAQIIQIPIAAQNDLYGNRKIVPKLTSFDYQKQNQNFVLTAAVPQHIDQSGSIVVPVSTMPRYDNEYVDEAKITQQETEMILKVLDLSMDDIANINRTVLAGLVDKSQLTMTQKNMVWEIRRKNKNRLAAAKCRKRKIEDINVNLETGDVLRSEFLTEKQRNITLREALQAEEVRLTEILQELSQSGSMSTKWITVKDALNEIKAALSHDVIEIDSEEVYELKPESSDYLQAATL